MQRLCLLALKSAYRQIAVATHPDTGGTHEAFLKKGFSGQSICPETSRVNAAYDLLQQYADIGGWDVYRTSMAKDWQKKFVKAWRIAYKCSLEGEFAGFQYSTCITQFRGREKGFGYADTPAAAICLAALRSLGIEIDLQLGSDRP